MTAGTAATTPAEHALGALWREAGGSSTARDRAMRRIFQREMCLSTPADLIRSAYDSGGRDSRRI